MVRLKIFHLLVTAVLSLYFCPSLHSQETPENSEESIVQFGDLSEWESNYENKGEVWSVEDGVLKAKTKHETDLFLKKELPDRFEVLFEASWQDLPGLKFMLGVPDEKKDDRKPVIESRDDAMVLNSGDEFGVLILNSHGPQSIKLRIVCDKVKDEVKVVRLEDEKVLKAKYYLIDHLDDQGEPEKRKRIIDGLVDGIYIKTKTGGLEIKQLEVREIKGE